MNLKIFILAVLIVVTAAGCFLFRQSNQPSSNTDAPISKSNEKSNESVNANQPVESDFNACALISNEEIEKLQGEKVVEAKNNSRTSDAIITSQCFYQLGNYSRSVSLEITQSAKSGSEKTDLNEIWKKKFDAQIFVDNDREEEEAEREERQEKEEKKGEKEKSETEKESVKPLEAVPNLGEAAFRVGNRISRALYVLDKNTIIRISLGGTDSEKIKAEKMTALAQKVLPKI